MLLYPDVGVEEGQASLEQHAGIVLNADEMAWLRGCYFGSEVHLWNPYPDPTAAANVSAVPPATVVPPGFDPLRDGGKAYAEQLDAASVSVRYQNYGAIVHGFLTLRGVDRTEAAFGEVDGVLQAAFGPGSSMETAVPDPLAGPSASPSVRTLSSCVGLV